MLLPALVAVGGWFFYSSQVDHALVMAVNASNLTGARGLLDRGADPNARSFDGNEVPVLMIAAMRSNPELVELLLDRGAKVDASAREGDTALIEAAGTGNVPVIELLLKHGANVNAVDDAGVTPLLNTASRCRPEALRLLLRHGADPSVSSKQGSAARLARKSSRLPSMTARCSETLSILAKEAPQR